MKSMIKKQYTGFMIGGAILFIFTHCVIAWMIRRKDILAERRRRRLESKAYDCRRKARKIKLRRRKEQTASRT